MTDTLRDTLWPPFRTLETPHHTLKSPESQNCYFFASLNRKEKSRAKVNGTFSFTLLLEEIIKNN